MSNSSLVNYTKISPNKTVNRNHKIDTITIHHMAGNLSVETCGEVFAPSSRNASSNYGIGTDGRVGMYVEEKDRSWASSSSSNDNRAVTIEVANDGGPDWHVSDKALDSLIKLCADICKRNGIPKMLWKDDKSLIGQIDKQNVTIHQWFAATACPGPYLKSKIGYVCDEVNKLLGASESTPAPAPSAPQPAPSKKSVHEVAKEVIAGKWGNGAERKKNLSAAGYNPSEVQAEVNAILSGKPSNKPAAFKSYTVKVTTNALNIRKGPGTNYSVTGCIRDKGIYTIVEQSSNWGKLKSGMGWICLDYTKKI